MQSQWQNFLMLVGAVLAIVLASVFYQPAAASTGSLLVGFKERVYVMDIDTLSLTRLGNAPPGQTITPAPGCYGLTETPCWVVVGANVYRTDTPGERGGLPVGDGFQWIDSTVSWSPDGKQVAYTVLDSREQSPTLRIFDVQTAEIKFSLMGVDPTIPVAWTPACADGVTAQECRIAFRTDSEESVEVVAMTPRTAMNFSWTVDVEQIYELRFISDEDLLYSNPKRHFFDIRTGEAVYQMPEGAQLANISPAAARTVYYQPFVLSDCDGSEEECMHLGVWLNEASAEEPSLIYNVNMAAQSTTGLNFIPTWSPSGNSFVFFQQGNLIHYNIPRESATIWYRGVQGKLRSVPVFSPNGEAVAFVDNQGQGHSEYRLVVVNPGLKPIEHIIDTEQGFRVLAWLPE